jgi:MsuE subfamily FMN reductase
MTLTILAINGSLTPPPSRTRALLEAAIAGARAADPEVRAEVLELRDLDIEFCDGRAPDQYNADTRRALALVEAADAYLVATPIYRASYTGALKNFFDLIPNDPRGSDPLRGKAVGLIASGGSDHHYLAVDHQLRPLLGFFGAQTLARGIYAAPKDFDAEKRPHGAALDQLTSLGRELVAVAGLLREAPAGFSPENLRAR